MNVESLGSRDEEEKIPVNLSPFLVVTVAERPWGLLARSLCVNGVTVSAHDEASDKEDESVVSMAIGSVGFFLKHGFGGCSRFLPRRIPVLVLV